MSRRTWILLGLAAAVGALALWFWMRRGPFVRGNQLFAADGGEPLTYGPAV